MLKFLSKYKKDFIIGPIFKLIEAITWPLPHTSRHMLDSCSYLFIVSCVTAGFPVLAAHSGFSAVPVLVPVGHRWLLVHQRGLVWAGNCRAHDTESLP